MVYVTFLQLLEHHVCPRNYPRSCRIRLHETTAEITERAKETAVEHFEKKRGRSGGLFADDGYEKNAYRRCHLRNQRVAVYSMERKGYARICR